MPLFKVQDADRPMWVVENDFQAALNLWGSIVAAENNLTPEEMDPPLGIQFICGNDELVVGFTPP